MVADACATRPLPGFAGGQFDAKALHEMELVALADFFLRAWLKTLPHLTPNNAVLVLALSSYLNE